MYFLLLHRELSRRSVKLRGRTGQLLWAAQQVLYNMLLHGP
jgi:hypothetical protein